MTKSGLCREGALLANILKEKHPGKQTALCLPDPSWRRFTQHQGDDASSQPLSPKYPGQFWGPYLSSPRSFSVSDHNMDPQKGCLFLKMGWEPRWEGRSAPKPFVLTASLTPTALNGLETGGYQEVDLQSQNHLFWPS